jgi:putative RNA 2'-phosphotransferase
MVPPKPEDPTMDETTRTQSSSLAGLLRHNAGEALSIDREGWADVAEAVEVVASRKNVAKLETPFDRETLLRVVEADEKGRFELSEDGSRIRAVSGHSIEVELPLVPFEPDGPLFFGTVGKKRDQIEADGLTAGLRKTVRLSRTLEEAQAIADGRIENRPNSDLGGTAVFEIDAEAMAADGIGFFLNSAGEVVTERVEVRYVSSPSPAPRP